ncbi:MAG: hypothetical protein WCK34_15120 [Bacteroidota bacterium]
MAVLKGKHNIAEVEGVRCSVVETGASGARAAFLKEMLSFNRYDVKIEQEKAKDGTLLETFVIGVTDTLFNAVIVLYQKKLFRKDRKTITPGYWNQKPEEDDIPYWQVQQ